MKEKIKEQRSAIIQSKNQDKAMKLIEKNKAIILDLMIEHVAYRDTKYKILWANKAAAESVNLTPKQLVGRYCYEVWHHRNKICKICPARDALEIGQHKESEITTPDGRIWSIHAYPFRDENGKIVGIANSTLEVTEQKKAEMALKESEEKYIKQFDSILDSIIVADAEKGIIIDCNKSACKLFGREKSELVGKHQKILHPKEEIEGKFSITFKKHLKEKEGQIIEDHVITKSGEIKDVAIKANIFEFKGKKLIQGVFRDITERKEAEEKIKRAYKTTKNIIENAPFGIYIVDDKGNIGYVNQAMLKISGDTYGQFKGLNVFELPTYKEINLAKKIKAALKGESFRVDSVKYTSHYGKKKVIRNFIGVPLEEERAKKVLMIVEDVTEQKRVEEELKNRVEELERFHRLAVGRELRMVELKKRIKELEGKLSNKK